MTDRPLWRSLRRPSKSGPLPGAEERRANLIVAAISGFIALGAIVVGSVFGNVHPKGPGNHVQPEIVAWASAVVLVVSGVIATRRVGTLLGHIVAVRTIRAAGVVVRLITAIVGYIVVLSAALGLLNVSIGHILTAGAFTGVVLGIAAQQSLGNVFAGMVLLLARPFTIGDHIRIRSGALGGIFDGVVLGMSLTYVTLSTDDGLLKIPNSGLLAAAVGPYRPKPTPVPGVGPTTGQVPVTGSIAVIPEPGTDTRPPVVVVPADEPALANGSSGAAQQPERVAQPSPWRELAAREQRTATPKDAGGDGDPAGQ
jgi:hypothetical protein